MRRVAEIAATWLQPSRASHRLAQYRDDPRAPYFAMSEINTAVIEPLKEFATKSIQLVKKCTKPDRKGKSSPARHNS